MGVHMREQLETLPVQREQGTFFNISLESRLSRMASSSTPAERLFITAKAMESMESDKIESYNALSQVLDAIFIKGYLTSYINCKIEDLGSLAIYLQLKSLCNKSIKMKPEYWGL